MKTLYFLLLLSLTQLPLSGQCLIQKALKNGTLEWEFRYDNQDRIVENVKYAENGQVESRYQVGYSGASRDIESIAQFDASGKATLKTVYTRDDRGRVTKMEMYMPDDQGILQLSRYYLYENSNPSGFSISQTSAYTANGTLLETTTVEYLDGNGSTRNTRRQADGTLIYTETRNRDDKSNYETWTPFPYQAKHNLTGKQIVMADGSLHPESFASEMEYNAQGYPVRERMLKQNGTEVAFEYVYRCR